MTDLEDVPEELAPSSTSLLSRLLELAFLGLAAVVVMLIFASASVRWPGSASAWAALGVGVILAIQWRVWGPPWGSS